jgi:hypothetical protein
MLDLGVPALSCFKCARSERCAFPLPTHLPGGSPALQSGERVPLWCFGTRENATANQINNRPGFSPAVYPCTSSAV